MDWASTFAADADLFGPWLQYGSFGVLVGVLAALGWAGWRVLSWLAGEVVKPLSVRLLALMDQVGTKHLQFLERTETLLTDMTEILKQDQAVLSRVEADTNPGNSGWRRVFADVVREELEAFRHVIRKEVEEALQQRGGPPA